VNQSVGDSLPDGVCRVAVKLDLLPVWEMERIPSASGRDQRLGVAEGGDQGLSEPFACIGQPSGADAVLVDDNISTISTEDLLARYQQLAVRRCDSQGLAQLGVRQGRPAGPTVGGLRRCWRASDIASGSAS